MANKKSETKKWKNVFINNEPLLKIISTHRPPKAQNMATSKNYPQELYFI